MGFFVFVLVSKSQNIVALEFSFIDRFDKKKKIKNVIHTGTNLSLKM